IRVAVRTIAFTVTHLRLLPVSISPRPRHSGSPSSGKSCRRTRYGPSGSVSASTCSLHVIGRRAPMRLARGGGLLGDPPPSGATNTICPEPLTPHGVMPRRRWVRHPPYEPEVVTRCP